jgi:hypothetical protein
MSDQDTLNDQIRDSLDQLQRTLEGMQQPVAAGASLQTVAHALGLALLNTVARQQHSHMLRNAMTAAAARALLDGRTDQAEAVLKLAESPLVNPTFEVHHDRLGLQPNAEALVHAGLDGFGQCHDFASGGGMGGPPRLTSTRACARRRLRCPPTCLSSRRRRSASPPPA